MDTYHQQSFIHPRHNDNTPLNIPSLLPITSHLFAIIFCYIVGTFGLNVLFITPIFLLLWLHWEHRYRLLAWTTELRVEYASIRQQVLKSGESVEWMNGIIEKWWTCCSGTISHFVKDWVEPIVNKFKFPISVESIKILTFDSGPYRMKFSNVRLLQPINMPSSARIYSDSKHPTQNDLKIFTPMTIETLTKPPIAMSADGRSVIAIEVDADLDVPHAEFKMKARVGMGSVSQNLALNIERFHIGGRLQFIVYADKRAPFPHLTTANVCFISTPVIDIQCRVLKDKLDVSNTPVLKQIMEKYIAIGFQKLLIYPGKQNIDFTPTLLPGPEWVGLKGRGLSQGVLTVKVECESTGGEKKSMLSNQYCKLRLGTQKCLKEYTNGPISTWSSTFSFLVHDPNTEKLHIKLKSRRKLRRDLTVAKQSITLQSLGIKQDDELLSENCTSIEKSQIRMSSDDGSTQMLLSLHYTLLPQFSLQQTTPALDNCDVSEAGVLYIHVHSAKNLRSHSSSTSYDPYCLVKHGDRSIFKTHTIFGTSDPIWEKGVEILIPSCRDVSLSFDIFHNSRGLGSHDLLGSTNLRLNRGQTQLIQHKILLLNSMRRSSSLPTGPASVSFLYISVVFRNVESISWTRDSLQEAYISRTQRQTNASCLDSTTKFLNPANQSFQSMSALPVENDEEVGSSSDDEINSINSSMSFADLENLTLSEREIDPEQSLAFSNHRTNPPFSTNILYT